MDPIQRVMRIMTHVNIGAALGMVAWIAWSGAQLVTGHWEAPERAEPAPHASSTQPTAATRCACAPGLRT